MSNESRMTETRDAQIRDRRGELRYWICFVIVWLFFHVFFRIRVVGRERVPRTGPVIIASNHISLFDPPLLGLCTPRFVHFMAKEELFRNRWIARLLRYLGGFPVRRGASDRGAIKFAIAVPEHGGCLVIFPEGHRSRDGKLRRGLPGIAFVAKKAGCPLVPAAIVGRYRLWGRLTVRFGEPYVPAQELSNEDLVDELMAKIQALIDEGHEGGSTA
jgi:1-acyl-sn-glycerol-3-phosphate acyltransferase